MVKWNWWARALLVAACHFSIGCRSPSPPPPERIELPVPIAAASVEEQRTESIDRASSLELATNAGTIASCTIQWTDGLDEKNQHILEMIRTMPLVVVLFKPKEKVVLTTPRQAKAAEWKESPHNGMSQSYRIERGDLSYNPHTGMLTIWLDNASHRGEEIQVARVISGLESTVVLEQLLRADDTFSQPIYVTIRLHY